MQRSRQLIKLLYDEYADPIYRFLYWHTGDAILAEDLMSEVFFRAWKHRGTLRDDQAKAWLYRVARNLTIDHYRRKHDTPLDNVDEPVSGQNVHNEAEWAETREQLHAALTRLTHEQRTIIVLRYFEHLSSKEVAVIMEKSEGNLRILQHRALKELRKQLSHV